jgi:putative Mg2+ transporter-C (MgtC) family protein
VNEFQQFIEVLRLDLGAKLLIAILAGGGIGLERELRGKPAGLRTNILICLGSALLMDLSMGLAFTHGGDPGRIAAQVVTGIGFLGAGTILHTRGTITGLTSAATIWVVAAIGLTVGAGFHFEALAATMTVMIVLRGLGWLEGRFIAPANDQHDGVPASEWQRRASGRRASDQGGASDSRAEAPPGDRDS